jgi:hypothetical protein
MDEDRLKQKIYALDRWKANLARNIEDFQAWLSANSMGTPEMELRVSESVDTLRSDKLTIAFVAEFSRGKTELINAIFFADYKRRLLPSTVGRTTMCPTELFYDQNDDKAYIRLLPIETRADDKSIADLKKDTNQWHHIGLNVDSADEMAEALKEVVRYKAVPVEEARRLGLYDEDPEKNTDKEIEIPVWRHAMISFPHPLLKQGLVILDTPGLNALGTEPELTLNMLPNAQAIVFVLAPDTGVTKSDLDVWEYYIKSAVDDANQKGIIATLNKIDTLWDEMMDDSEIAAAIENQRTSTASMLGIDPGNVLTVSAQKALLAKSKHDQALLEKSQILTLEALLADEIVPAKQRIVGDRVIHEIGAMMNNTRDLVQSKLDKVNNQLKNLQSISGRNTDVIKHLTQKTREQQIAYNNNMKYLQSSRRTLAQNTANIMNELNMEAFDYLVNKTRRDMTESWTTAGLKSGMKSFFDNINDTMQVVSRQMGQAHELIESVYQKFHDDHGLPEMTFKQFSMESYQSEMEKLILQAEEFRNSKATTMTEQSFVVKKFFISIVSHAREVFHKAHRDADNWLKEIMNPLIAQITIHKQLLEQHLDTLCKINETKETLSKNITALRERSTALQKQLEEIDRLRNNIDIQIPQDVASASSNPGGGDVKNTAVAAEVTA